METVTLKIKDKNKFRHFMTFIKDLDYVEVLAKDASIGDQKSTEAKGDFFALAGMWENRSISADELRAKAWPERK